MRNFLKIGFIALASCSSSTDPPAAVEDTGSPDTNATDTAVVDAPSDSDAAPLGKGLGFVGVLREKLADKTVVAINGGFYDNSNFACPLVENHGACQFSRCPSGAPVVGKARDAGTVHIVHGTDPAIELTKSGHYNGPELPDTYFKEGDTFVFSSTGAEVPAFADESVVAPGDLTATLPSEIDRTTDLTLTWTGDTTGDVRLLLRTGDTAGNEEQISCAVPASSGSYTLTKDVLGKLTGAKGSLTLSPIAETRVETDRWIVNLEVEALGVFAPVTFH